MKRIGVIADPHSNAVALKAVMEEMPEVDQLICAGDLVGYGPQPNEVVEMVGSMDSVSVLGNHDHAVITGEFNSYDELAAEAERAATVTNTAIKFSYSVLRQDGRRRYDLALDRSNVAKLAATEAHVGERIDLVAAKLSRNLAEDGHPLYKVSDGSEATNHFAVLVRETELNRDLSAAAYGDLLQFSNVLALYNDDEAAYNLVVDEATIVDAA